MVFGNSVESGYRTGRSPMVTVTGIVPGGGMDSSRSPPSTARPRRTVAKNRRKEPLETTERATPETCPRFPYVSPPPPSPTTAASDPVSLARARARRLRAMDGFAASLAFHLAIAFVMAVRLISYTPNTGVHISGSLGNSAAPGEIDLERIGSLEVESVEASEATAPEMPAFSPSSEAMSTDQLALEGASLTDGEEFRAAVERAATGGTGSGSGIGGDAGEVAFFGSGSAGTSFVFVVDLSGSMVEQDRFGRMVRELSSTILAMGSEQKFSVVFFNDHAVPLFAPRASVGLIAASNANKQKAVRWIRTRKPTV